MRCCCKSRLENQALFDPQLEDDTQSETAPVTGPQALFTNQLGILVDRTRDLFITQIIAKSLNKYDRVLVVYGGSHFLTQKLVLEDLLGKVKKFKN